MCNTSLNFSDATGPKGVSSQPGHKTDIDWYWENPSLTWSAGLQRLLTLSATSTALATEVDPPTVSEAPRVSDAGPDGEWGEGEAVEVTVTFSEAVVVDTAGGTPSIGIALGGNRGQERRVRARNGHDGAGLLLHACRRRWFARSDDGEP